jgi:hypothetical protein
MLDWKPKWKHVSGPNSPSADILAHLGAVPNGEPSLVWNFGVAHPAGERVDWENCWVARVPMARFYFQRAERYPSAKTILAVRDPGAVV